MGSGKQVILTIRDRRRCEPFQSQLNYTRNGRQNNLHEVGLIEPVLKMNSVSPNREAGVDQADMLFLLLNDLGDRKRQTGMQRIPIC